jgi:ParB-like chromosome segregation protein Spo0J
VQTDATSPAADSTANNSTDGASAGNNNMGTAIAAPPLLPSNNWVLREIPVALLDPAPVQYRLDLNEAEAEGDLESSIRRFGVQTPLRAKRSEGDRFAVIDGNRRLRSVRKLLEEYAGSKKPAEQAEAERFRTLPCLVEADTLTEEEDLILQWNGNAVRKNFTPLEQARILRRLQEINPKLNQTRLAKYLHITQGYVSRLLQLAGDADLLGKVAAGKLTAASAYKRICERKEKGAGATGGGAGERTLPPAGGDSGGGDPDGELTAASVEVNGRVVTGVVVCAEADSATRLHVFVVGKRRTPQDNVITALRRVVTKLEAQQGPES